MIKIVITINTISNTIIPRKMTSRTPDHTTHVRLCIPYETTKPSGSPRDRNRPMKVQRHRHKYGHTNTVKSVDLLGKPMTTPRPEVGIPFWLRSKRKNS